MSPLWRIPVCFVASATVLISSSVSAAPPVLPEEPAAIGEAPPVLPEEPAPVVPPEPEPEPAPEPVPEPIAPLPSWDAALPSHDAPEAFVPGGVSLDRPTTPRDGNGATVAGAMLLGGGLVLTPSSVALLFADDEPVVWALGTVFGAGAIVGGMILVISGAKQRKRYAPWQQQHEAPARGTGMRAGGGLALSTGALAMLLGGISLGVQDPAGLPYGEVLLTLGASAVVTGSALLIVGGQRRKRFETWEQVQLSPSFGFVPGARAQTRPAGATFGVTGRF